MSRRRIGALLVATALSLAIAAGIGASTSSPGTALVDGIPQRGTVMGQVDAESTQVANQIAVIDAEAKKLGVEGTPWFYLAVGFNPPVNFRPRSFAPNEFRTPIDQALKAGG